ncbi:copper homeostasis protein CutC [Caulobacter sp. BP25]|uniref:copper homeostasis protein CutC n=1 Tax=Caulobacter sp. BP25 TaxID=2048900 RepID=UPI000C12D42D|nr:copper homeostasis protein CutC [Caulobacter sp. BP25]PHY17111.1 copper homeostasis protein CutC [Caulobacter sp. BP25]
MTAANDLVKGRVLLEVCVDTPAGLAAAIAGGADRIELCAALTLQGLTPAPGLMALAAASPIPVYPMIRPRNGDFCYDTRDLDAMKRDIDAVRAYGLEGVSIGASRPDGELDLEVLAALVEHAQGLGLTLHRAFDLVADQSAALEAAIEMGFERVLTSGGAISAVVGAERIAALMTQAGGRISILAGAGVRVSNIAELVRTTGVREVHGSFGAAKPGADPASKLGAMGFVPPTLQDTDQATVAEVVRILRGLS